FVEFIVDELLDGIERIALVDAVCFDHDCRAAARGQQQDPEDRFAVHFLIALAHFDVRLEPRGRMDELRRGASMKTQLVLDLDGPLGHTEAPARFSAVSSSEQTRMALEPFSLMTCASVDTSFASCFTIA